MPEYYLKYLGGARYVHRYVAMTPLYAGTDLGGLASFSAVAGHFGLAAPVTGLVAGFCASCPEFLAGSAMVRKLNAGAGGPAVPGIQYTTIPTRYDELVAPYTSGLLHARNATNHVLQDVCPGDTSEHVAEAFDPVVAQLILNGLDPANAQRVSCNGLPEIAVGGRRGPGRRHAAHHRARSHRGRGDPRASHRPRPRPRHPAQRDGE